MTNTNEYYVRGKFVDKNCNENSDKPIKFALSNFDLTIEADDMKKAYDLAVEYMPAGSVVTELCLSGKHQIYYDRTRRC